MNKIWIVNKNWDFKEVEISDEQHSNLFYNKEIMDDRVKEFTDFFAKQKPEKVIEAMKLVNTAMEKDISELELAIKLTSNPKIKQIFKDILKLKIDKL